jgi:hypothetical protein
MQEFEIKARQAGHTVDDLSLKPKVYRPYLYPSFYGVSMGAASAAKDHSENIEPTNQSKP